MFLLLLSEFGDGVHVHELLLGLLLGLVLEEVHLVLLET